MDPYQAAIDEIESLKEEEDFSYTEVATRHGLHRSTLSRRHRGVTRPHQVKISDQQKLTPEQEVELVQYIKGLTERHLPPTREMIRNFASTIAKEPVSESWVTRFINRHSIHLISHWTAGMDSNRHNADSEDKYRLHFEYLHGKIDQYQIDPRHSYNIDEKGFLIGIIGRSKRIFSRRMWEKKEVTASLQDGNRAWITLLACICADGSALPPSLIYEAANKGIQSAWVEDIKAGKHDVFITSSPSGWTNNGIGLARLEQVFDRCTKEKARRSYRLLVLDGHGSHITMDFIDYCDQNRILLAILPPHSTHTLQPLDVAMFKPLSTAYSAELSKHLHRSQGLVPITKGDFFPLFWNAWNASFKESTILSSFKSTGISPPDPTPILDRFAHDKDSGHSSLSGLSDHDWRKMDRLVRSAFKDQSSRDTQKLRSSLHHLSVQNELLQHENTRLREALAIKKKRTRKSKALDLQQRDEYHGGSVLWSPRKVREARVRQSIKEREDKEEQLQKAETAELRKAAKLYKEKIQQEKRVAREVAKKEKEKERADKAAQRAAQKSARDAEKALQLSQKGKRKASQAPLQRRKRQKRVVDALDTGEASEGASATPAISTRHGRSVKLPNRYK
jgi:hypothetical protein